MFFFATGLLNVLLLSKTDFPAELNGKMRVVLTACMFHVAICGVLAGHSLLHTGSRHESRLSLGDARPRRPGGDRLLSTAAEEQASARLERKWPHHGVPASQLDRRSRSSASVSVDGSVANIDSGVYGTSNAWQALQMSVFKPKVLHICPQVIRLKTSPSTSVGEEINALFALGKDSWDSRSNVAGFRYSVFTFNLDAQAGETWRPVDADLGSEMASVKDGCGVSATATPSRREVIIMSCLTVIVWRDLTHQSVDVKGELDEEVLLNFYSAASGLQSDGERVSLFVFGGKSAQVWELAFTDSTLKLAEWRRLTHGSSGGPPPRVMAGLHYAYQSLILYGGDSYPTAGQPTSGLCDLWELNVTTGTWTPFGFLSEDCTARQACQNVSLSYIHTYTLSAYLPAANCAVAIVSQCTGRPYFEVWMRKRGAGQAWVKTPDSPLAVSKNGGTPQLSYAVSSLMVSDMNNSGYLVLSNYATQETKIYQLVQLASNNPGELSQSAILVDVDGRKDYFIGSTGCRTPPPIRLGLFVGGRCSALPAMLENAQSEPTVVWSRTINLQQLTSQWTQNTISPSPLYGNRIGQSVVRVTSGATREKAILFGGLVSIDFLRFYVNDLFFVPSELWCFEYQKGYLWQKAVLESSPPQQPSPRAYQTVSAFDGVIYMFGGISEGLAALNELWTFEFSSFDNCQGKWTELTAQLSPGPPPALYGHTATILLDSLYVFGGSISVDLKFAPVVSQPFVLDLGNLSWRTISSSTAVNRIFHSATAIGFAGIAVLGGCTAALAVSGRTCKKLTDSVFIFPSGNGSADVQLVPFKVSNTPPSQAKGVYNHHTLLDDESQQLVVFGGVLEELDSVGTVTFAKLVSPTDDAVVFKPGCPAGHSSTNLLEYPCSRCPLGTYSSADGAGQCMPCAQDITTNKTGSQTAASCSQCRAGFCNSGKCSIDPEANRPTCKCQAGFSSFDNCFFPVYYVAGAVVFVIAAVIVGCLLNRSRKKAKLAREKAFELRQKRREIEQLNAAWEIEASELNFMRRLDSDWPGGFGEVHLAGYRDILVAVKKLQRHLTDEENAETFRHEAETMRTIRHPNVVLFLGAGSFRSTQQAFLVMEFVKGGTLIEKLTDVENVAIDHPQRLRFALDIAKAMRYLHSQDPPRIHRDLKSCNLLVSQQWVVKVSDFGTSRRICERFHEREMETSVADDSAGERTQLLQSEAVFSENVGTTMWMSPEVLARRPYGSSTDVYRYALVC